MEISVNAYMVVVGVAADIGPAGEARSICRRGREVGISRGEPPRTTNRYLQLNAAARLFERALAVCGAVISVRRDRVVLMVRGVTV